MLHSYAKQLLAILFLFISLFHVNAQQNSDLEKALESHLADFQTCREESPELVRCYEIIGKSLKTAYGINDFYSTENGEYMSFNQIVEFVKNDDKWEAIGYGYEQQALNAAQESVNSGNAVISIFEGDESGHLAFIIPGQLTTSGSWGMRVPNSASFFTANPEKSYVGKGLSYAFTTGMLKSLTLYRRK